jgi:hypothetical protein
MSSELTQVLVASTPGFIAGLGLLIETLRNQRRQKAQLDEIHLLVNANLAKAVAEIASLRELLTKAEKHG